MVFFLRDNQQAATKRLLLGGSLFACCLMALYEIEHPRSAWQRRRTVGILCGEMVGLR
jgi:hypothetical protein